jgi:hypothetical protein
MYLNTVHLQKGTASLHAVSSQNPDGFIISCGIGYPNKPLLRLSPVVYSKIYPLKEYSLSFIAYFFTVLNFTILCASRPLN